MSQNRTVFPGMDAQDNFNGYRQEKSNSASSKSRVDKGTVFPGMESASHSDTKFYESTTNTRKNKPIIGFLYSVSRTGFGEYWPLYIGANTIGRSPKNDIVLPEGTVSEEHAILVVRIMRNSQQIDASISDERSTHGSMVNENSIPSTRPLECKNGDVITIGQAYQLYLVLINAKDLGLGLAENFIDASANLEYDEADEFEGPRFRSSNGSERPTKMQQEPPRFSGSSNIRGTAPGTVGMDGGKGPSKGGTHGMDDSNSSSFSRGGTQW